MRIVVTIGDMLVRQPLSLHELRAEAALVGSRLAGTAAHHDLVVALGSGVQPSLLGWRAADSGGAPPPHSAEGSELQRELLASHLLRLELANALPADKPIASILTTTEVDPRDPAFDEPTATVGPSYDELQATQVSEQQQWALRPEGSLWRRAVPRPEPRRILESQPIEWLLTQGCIVVCTPGGPVMYLPGTRTLAPAEVVVDPLQATSLLAIDIDADQFVITAVSRASLPAIPGADPHLQVVHPDHLATLRGPDGAVPSEFRAADAFTRATGHTTVLGELGELPELLAGTSGIQVALNALSRPDPSLSGSVSPLSRRKT